MNTNQVYSTMNEDDDYEMPYRVKDRVSNKRIEKRERQAIAGKNTKKGTRKENRNQKNDSARIARANRPREISLLSLTNEE
jgi:hypothetical protein